MLEMCKLIPRLVTEFDFEIEEKSKVWKTVNYWFVKPVNFRVKVQLRKKVASRGNIETR